jgi:hypothetical protein
LRQWPALRTERFAAVFGFEMVVVMTRIPLTEVNCQNPAARKGKPSLQLHIRQIRWQSLGESNPSFQVENLTS